MKEPKPNPTYIENLKTLTNNSALKALIKKLKLDHETDESYLQEFSIQSNEFRFRIDVDHYRLTASYNCNREGAPNGHDSFTYTNDHMDKFVEDAEKLYKKFCNYREYQQYHIDLMVGKVTDIPRSG